jgi:hypothetical protein
MGYPNSEIEKMLSINDDSIDRIDRVERLCINLDIQIKDTDWIASKTGIFFAMKGLVQLYKLVKKIEDYHNEKLKETKQIIETKKKARDRHAKKIKATYNDLRNAILESPYTDGMMVHRDGEGSIAFYRKWNWEIEDTSLVPQMYTEPSKDKITDAIKAGMRNIPGIRVYQTKTMRIRPNYEEDNE